VRFLIQSGAASAQEIANVCAPPPDDAEALRLAAVAASLDKEEEGELEAAEDLAARAVKIEPGSVEGWATLALALATGRGEVA
jgi:hypothetical protein